MSTGARGDGGVRDLHEEGVGTSGPEEEGADYGVEDG